MHTGINLLLNFCLFLQNVPYADAMNKTLVFAIFDFDRFSKHDQIGEVKLPLCQVDLAQTIEDWRELQSVEGEGGQVGRSFRCTVLSTKNWFACMSWLVLGTYLMDQVRIIIIKWIVIYQLQTEMLWKFSNHILT
jgi:hypothetical protein